MLRSIIISTVACLALAACSDASKDKQEADTDKTEVEVAKDNNSPPAGKSEVQIQQELKVFQDTVEKAMNEIPPELRVKFQTAFNCEIEANKTRPVPTEIDAATIRQITARLKAGDPGTC